MNPARQSILASLLLLAPALAADEFNAVEQGKKVFESMNCIVCHATTANEKSNKTGPSLYGRFVTEPEEYEIVDAKTGKRKKVRPDEEYFRHSIRKPGDELSIAAEGPLKGQPYPPMMPTFLPEVISDQDLNSLWHYVRTLAEPGRSGPTVVMMRKKDKAAEKSLAEIQDEIVVDGRARVFRARIPGMSGRSLYVGLPGHLNFGFDPRLLSARRVWTGGFLNLREERNGRGGRPSSLGHQARIILDDIPLLAPLTIDGKAVDFEFKEPDVGDEAAIRRHLNDPVSFLDRIKSVDAEFLGHRIAPQTGIPTFRFRVNESEIEETIQLSSEGSISIKIRAKAPNGQIFKLRNLKESLPTVSGGQLAGQTWTLPSSEKWTEYSMDIPLPLPQPNMLAVGGSEDLSPRNLVIHPANAGKRSPVLPSGYSMTTWETPPDFFGRKMLFEPTGIDVAKDGTIVLSTRTAGVWRIRDGKWSVFAEGIYESLGVCIEDDRGDRIVITQKPELTRLIDTDGDGRADEFQTVCDDFEFHADYHEYTHGPVRDSEGNYYFNLNLAHHKDDKVSWRAGGKFMGTMGGYRGWPCRVSPQGTFEPFASGLRSPAGMGVAPNGRIWYTENQGEYVGSSKLVPLEQGKFYGHVSAMLKLPDMQPDSPELAPEKWQDKLRKGAVWLPHRRLSNSPGNPVWDTTGGKFGIHHGDIFIPEQTLSSVMRVVTEQVNGIDQGCVMPFAGGLSSGGMRPCFLPDGSMLIGQTGRGWGSRGGLQYALQQIRWDGRTTPVGIDHVSTSASGFEIHFTVPLNNSTDTEMIAKKIKVASWTYINSPAYGSPEADSRNENVESLVISEDRMRMALELKGFGEEGSWLDRVYHLSLAQPEEYLSGKPTEKQLEAFVTLRSIPDRKQAAR